MMASVSTAVAGVLCFIASSISSVGGMGGGGLFIPILSLVLGFELSKATTFSAFMVAGGSFANVICYLIAEIGNGGLLINYDLVLISEPCMLLGVSVGVLCNLSFPQWLITLLFALFLSYSTWKTCRNGVILWRQESLRANRSSSEPAVEDGFHEAATAIADYKEMEEPLVKETRADIHIEQKRCPWRNFGFIILIWLSFFCISLLRGNRYGKGIISLEACGVVYWILFFVQIPLAGFFTAWMLVETRRSENQTSNLQDEAEEFSSGRRLNKVAFPFMALLAGILGGMFGIGGGLLISPLLLQLGILPEVASATCSFMVFFSSTMSVFQYVMLGIESVDIAILFAILCFVGSLIGLQVVRKVIKVYGRASVIVFSVGIVMLLSTILMTTFEGIGILRDISSSHYMGFKSIC